MPNVTTSIIPPRVPMVDPNTGYVTREWYRFFLSQYSSIDGGAPLTRTNDTNVFLSLTGTPASALLAPTNIAVGWSGQLGLARGGTGSDFSGTGGTGQVVKQSSPGAPLTVGTLSGGDIIGEALTKTDDTNVTLTLGGTPSTALLRPTSLTLGWSGQLGTTRGGTGLGSYSAGDMIYASAANTLAPIPFSNVSVNGVQYTPVLMASYSPVAATPSWQTNIWTVSGIDCIGLDSGNPRACAGLTPGGNSGIAFYARRHGDFTNRIVITNIGEIEFRNGTTNSLLTTIYAGVSNLNVTSGISTTGGGFVANNLPTATYLLHARKSGDSQPRFYINENGKMNWGSGGTAADVTQERSGVGVLTTTGSTAATGYVQAGTAVFTGSFTVATQPSAATAAGWIYVTDEVDGAVMAFSDGTNWRRCTDRAIISS